MTKIKNGEATPDQKLLILVGEARFKALEKVDAVNYKVTVVSYNGTMMRNISYVSNREDAINWALKELKLMD